LVRSGPGPLVGLRVAVTRPRQPDDALAVALRDRGATPVVVPLVAIAGVEDRGPLQRAVRDLAQYDWIIFTSGNAVRFFRDGLAGEAAAGVAQPRVAAVGPATARAVEQYLHWRVDAVPSTYEGGALTSALAQHGPLRGARVLWPRALDARAGLGRDLVAAGAVLDAPPAYRTVEQPAAARELAALLAAGAVDIVTLTSPSAVRALAAAGPSVGGALVAVIGRVTAAAAAGHELPVHVVPREHTIPALVDAIEAYLRRGAG
jgi:uroporphyrinogen-III synthase